MAEEQRSHTLALKDRKKLTMTGVDEVVSFDETAVVVKTALGTLVIQGTSLQLKELSPQGGALAVEGTVTALAYQQLGSRAAGSAGCLDDGAGGDGGPAAAGAILGAGLGLLYGALEPPRRRFPGAMDGIFLLAVFRVWLELNFRVCGGDVRPGWSAGLALGFLLWRWTAGRALRPLFYRIWGYFANFWEELPCH